MPDALGRPLRDRGGQPPAPGWKQRFLTALRDTQLVFESCNIAGISRAHAYRQRKLDPEFAAAWQDELERGTEILEQIAVRRAAEGSDTLMIFLLKARRPEVYRDNVFVDHQHTVQGQIALLPGDTQPVQIEASKRREAAQLLLQADAEDRQEATIEGSAETLAPQEDGEHADSE